MIFEVENGTFFYGSNGRTILNDISIQVESGDICAVLGANGSGKTTFLRCALGFLKWKSGKSILDGKDTSKIESKSFWQTAAYIPQAKTSVSPYTVEQTVLMGRSAYIGAFSSPKKTDYDIMEEMIEKFGLGSIRKRNCNEISGGELQMVLIARAVAAKPKLLVLDEPESNLDFKNQLMILDTITELAKNGTACIFNTHYPAHALRKANKSLILSKEGSYRFGETSEIVTEESIRDYFGVNAVISDVPTEYGSIRNVVAVSRVESEDKK